MKKDNIEEIYSALEGFSKEPPKELWDNIEAKLHPKKKKRRGILFLWGSAAAVLLLFIGYVITGLPESNDMPATTITDSEEQTINDTIAISQGKTVEVNNEALIDKDESKQKLNRTNSTLKTAIHQDKITDNISLSDDKEHAEVIAKHKSSKHRNVYLNGIETESYVNDNYTLVNEDEVILQIKNKGLINFKNEEIVADVNMLSVFTKTPSLNLFEELEALNKELSDSLDMKTADNSKWSVEFLGGLSNTASESSIQGTDVNTRSQNDFVYTFKLGFAISDKLILKSGIGKNILGQDLNNVLYASTDTTLSADNFQSIVSDQNIVLLGTQASYNDVGVSNGNINEGNLQQQFDYIQLPLELSYNILKQSKYNVSLGIGGNVNFLTNNRTFLNDEQIGESLGVNSTIFGASINSNFSYEIAKKMILFIEPSYNYFEKPIANYNQSFNNTQLRALFGLRYKF